jgi:adenylate cyclase
MDEIKTIDRSEVYDITAQIRELMLEEQIAMKDVQALKAIAESRARVVKALKEKTRQFHSYLESSDNFLRSRIGSRVHLVILYADLVRFTHMSIMLPLENLTTILQIFAQEMTVVVANNYGYILKYVGDAIIAYFPIDSAANLSMSIRKAVLCAMDMLIVVDQGINDVLKDFDFPDLHIRIGIDSGEIAVIEYGSTGIRSHIDILGYPMNVTAKIEALAPPDHILIGNATYNGLDTQMRDKLKKLGLEGHDYIDYRTGDAYLIYSFGFQFENKTERGK